ncbi:hypothetical protein AC1031_012491 [Aphanomyces cochlioides]|nr:hypothetical protein AC1031_012491 [Aphanomyces cochlioides]
METPRDQPRAFIDSTHLSTLLSVYNVEFPKYCKDRKKSVSQLIPKKVWAPMYEAYKKEFPSSTFEAESLKEACRQTLRELNTGTSNATNSNSAEIQPGDLLASLKLTNAHQQRCVLVKRKAIADDLKSPSAKTTHSETLEIASSPNNEEADTKRPCTSGGRHVNKADAMTKQAQSIVSIAETLKQSRGYMNDYFSEKGKQAKISNLKQAHAMGTIDDATLKKRVNELLDIE